VALQKKTALDHAMKHFFAIQGRTHARFTYSRMKLIVWVRDGLAPIPLTLTIFLRWIGESLCASPLVQSVCFGLKLAMNTMF
jgi:hypothetical protein